MTGRLWRAALVAAALTGSARAADLADSLQVVTSVYDVGFYTAELDRVMQEADGRGVFGGRGSTAAGRARDRSLTRAAMLGQRNAVMHGAAETVAARAPQAQVTALLRAAAGDRRVDPALLDAAVVTVKASFNDALWAQMSRVARGNAEFTCLKGDKAHCR